MKARRQIGVGPSAFAPWEDPALAPLVRFESVSKRFGETPAVQGVSLSIYEGEFFALLGPSGCGKTTLMRMLAGFEAPDEGRILLAGEDVAPLPPHRRPVHMMFQSYALFPHLNVAQNIAFGLKQQKAARAQIAARVEEMLALVKLSGLGRRRPDQLSGGQRQRVALARALAPRPRILLLDEPLAALDRKLREETQFELMALQQNLGMTFVVVTHDRDEAMILANRIAVMRDGQLAQVGRPVEIYENPADRYVAGFGGDVNLFEGTLVLAEGRRAHLASPDGRFEAEFDNPVEIGSRAWLAVRPEKMLIAAEPPSHGSNSLPGRISDIGYLGDWTTYLIEVAPGRTLRAARANAGRRAEAPLARDDTVWLSFAPHAAMVLTR